MAILQTLDVEVSGSYSRNYGGHFANMTSLSPKLSRRVAGDDRKATDPVVTFPGRFIM